MVDHRCHLCNTPNCIHVSRAREQYPKIREYWEKAFNKYDKPIIPKRPIVTELVAP